MAELDIAYVQITAEEYAEIARALFGKPNRNENKFINLDREIQQSLIGTSYNVCAELWNMINPYSKLYLQDSHPQHLLWALLFLYCYCTLPILSRIVGGVEDAEFSKWSWIFVEEIYYLKGRVILWENRWFNWNQQSQALVSIDTTDCAHREIYPFNTRAYSHKFNGPGWRYEVAVSIACGDIVWVNGPFEGGRNDETIFKDDGLLALLLASEVVECDGGYKGHWKLKNPSIFIEEWEKRQKGNIRARHEIVNSRLKRFMVLDGVFRHNDMEKHGLCFHAVAVIVQLGFDLNGGLHDVEYDVVYHDGRED